MSFVLPQLGFSCFVLIKSIGNDAICYYMVAVHGVGGYGISLSSNCWNLSFSLAQALFKNTTLLLNIR